MSGARWKPREVAVPRLPICGDHDMSGLTSGEPGHETPPAEWGAANARSSMPAERCGHARFRERDRSTARGALDAEPVVPERAPQNERPRTRRTGAATRVAEVPVDVATEVITRITSVEGLRLLRQGSGATAMRCALCGRGHREASIGESSQKWLLIVVNEPPLKITTRSLSRRVVGRQFPALVAAEGCREAQPPSLTKHLPPGLQR